jgi:hypothetical protein
MFREINLIFKWVMVVLVHLIGVLVLILLCILEIILSGVINMVVGKLELGVRIFLSTLKRLEFNMIMII